MKHIKALIAVILVGSVMWFFWSKYSDFLYRGQLPTPATQILNKMEESGVPDFTINDIHQNEVKLSQFKDSIVILNFWASWCDPCIEEFPSLLQLIDKYNGKVKLIAISADNNVDDLNNFLKAFKAESPNLIVAWDKDQIVAKKYGTTVLPESYILGLDNKLIRKVAGVEDWSSPYAIEFFDNLIGSQNK
jgi:cytochrome c biogenesis protein CcmG/thiol:disulfide interchange protein DsbE